MVLKNGFKKWFFDKTTRGFFNKATFRPFAACNKRKIIGAGEDESVK
jgi:hypothetical protein